MGEGLDVGGRSKGGRRSDAPDASDRLTSFSVRGTEVGHFHEVAGVSIAAAGGPRLL